MVQSKLEIWYNFWWRCCFSKLGAFFYRGDQKCYLQLLADRWKWTSGESIIFLENLYILKTANIFPISNPKRYTFLIFELKDETHEYMNIWPEKVNQPSMFYPLVQIIMPRSNPFRCCIVYLGPIFLGLFRTARLDKLIQEKLLSKLGHQKPGLSQGFPDFWDFVRSNRWSSVKYLTAFSRAIMLSPAHLTAAEAVLREKLFQEQASKLGRWNLKLSIAHCQG